MEINYLTENPSREYAKVIRQAKSLAALRKGIMKFREVAPDAMETVNGLSVADFRRFRKDLPKFKRAEGELADRLNREWGDIVIPRKLMWSTVVAERFHAPWGTAFIRLEQFGWPWEKKS